MSARYLIRFDDICPTMSWDVWKEIEQTLLELDVKPILAVVPDNQDEKLRVAEANPRFWEEVRKWQGWGWTIGWHGHQHRYLTRDGGIVALNDRSEFAGVSEAEQHTKLQQALAIFERENVRPEVWIAPGHSFDAITLKVLRELGMYYISDGFFLFPGADAHRMMWIPQQLWRFRAMPLGVWTVCLHHNGWQGKNLQTFRRQAKSYRESLASFLEIRDAYRGRRVSWTDALASRAMLAAHRVKRIRRRW
jgi:predicted deacetylase